MPIIPQAARILNSVAENGDKAAKVVYQCTLQACRKV
jgi:hypothetical protein